MEIDFRQQIREMQTQTGLTTNQIAVGSGLRCAATLYRYLQGISEMNANNLAKVITFLSETHSHSLRQGEGTHGWKRIGKTTLGGCN